MFGSKKKPSTVFSFPLYSTMTIYKKDNDTETNSHIRRLADEERVEELAQMLSGSTLTDAALNNARVLLGFAAK